MTESDALRIATHRHYKGGLYRIIADAVHTETDEKLIVYAHVWPNAPGVYCRPKAMFYDVLASGRRRFDPLPHYTGGFPDLIKV